MSRIPSAARRGLSAAALIAAFAAAPIGGVAGEVTSPEEHLGRPVGGDFTLADWDEVSSFYERLAAESPRVRLERIGATTEGRDMLLAVITGEANQARLPEIQAASRRIADPRGLTADERATLLDDGRVVLFISPAMHSTEVAAPQFAMELAWRLATSDEEPYRTARERLVVCLLPCTNPDGLDQVVRWYRRNVGTPYEGAGLLELYQRYAGHDNNRDWFSLALAETRLVTRQLYHEWLPQVYWDVHQQGRSSERMFVPPFRDPLDPNLDPAVIAGINTIGTRALFDMTRAGLTGIGTGSTYDMWWNGGNRNVPVRHNIIGLLTEAASANLASPVFLERSDLSPPTGREYIPSNQFPAPWPGGWWRLRDIIDYEHAFARSLLRSLSDEPRTWLANVMDAADRAVAAGAADAPVAWVLPSDQRDVGAVRRLVDILLHSGVEVHVADGAARADGREWPAGSIVIRADQPYRAVVKDLFEVQTYPEGDPPYDVAGWTLPLLFGVHRVEVAATLEAGLREVDAVDAAVAGFSGRAIEGLDAGDSDGWRAVIAGLAGGERFLFHSRGDAAGAFTAGVPEGPRPDGAVEPRLPRIGLYAPWSGSMDEGWLRWVFDEFGLPYQRVRNEHLRAGRLLDDFDALVIADVTARQLDRGRGAGSIDARWTGGLDPEGAVAIEEFVRGGGRLVATDSSAWWAVDLFGLLVEDATRGQADFSCPGSVLRAVPEGSRALVAGLPPSMAVFFSRSSAFRKKDGVGVVPETLLSYADQRVLLSGYLRGPAGVAGHGAWQRARVGDGAVHLFAFRPHYRSWSHGAFQLLFRALLLDPR